MASDERRKLGTFLGVYTPTILTILGAIMYLRSGWIVGHLGLMQTLAIVVIANFITLVTTLSFSSVATNLKIGVGGAYFIISRSLGLELGGAIGLPLFLSQALSVTLYAFGLAESLRLVLPDVNVQLAAFIIVIAVSVLSFAGAKLALSTQIPIMALIGVSLLALIWGAFSHPSTQGIARSVPSGEISFWAGFAIFFPAVTGVMAGLGLSGDLKNPGKSIPIGAILAVLTGFVIYISLPFILIVGANQSELRADTMIWTRIAPLGPWLILPGLWGAIFSSAVGSMLGAPRTLQALSADGLAPRILGGRQGRTNDLLPGFIITVAIALGAVLLGDLNAVAPVVTMFFLTIYGTLNIVAAIETLSGDTSWRPKLNIPWFISLAGGIACIGAMFLISTLAGLIAVTAELILWLILSRREYKARWGDARRGIYEALARWAILRLSLRPMSARNWRPHVMVFASDLSKQINLVRFADWFSQGRGLVTVCQLVIADLLEDKIDHADLKQKMQNVLDGEELTVFAEVNVVRNVVDGIINVAQANGMAGIQSNTVMLGWPKDQSVFTEFIRVMRRLDVLNKSLLIGKIDTDGARKISADFTQIDVWWGGLQRNGDLMLLLAYLLSRNNEWRSAKIRVLSIASTEIMRQQTENYLEKLIPEIRIQADVQVILKPKEKSVKELIQEKSANSDVIFIGLATPENGEEAKYAKRLEELAGNLHTVFFVKNSSLFIGELLDPCDKQ